MDYDALIVGGGTAGMESALNLGDMGYSVLLVEKEASIGGTMILLSKVFPTLDCASCIATPKMASAFHHPRVTTATSAEVTNIVKRADGTFEATILHRATSIDPSKCTGCQQCEEACTVAVPDQFNFGMVARRAAYIPFSQAVPKKAVIERAGSSPCSFACPTGIKAHGYISLIRSGKYDEAMELILEDSPLAGSLARACYAPCEDACTRSDLEGALPIRMLKRYVVDRYYERHPHPLHGPPDTLLDHRVAIVGSGPAGLAAAYDLARLGYRVEIFEASPKPGGMLCSAIPRYRLPADVVARDVENVTALGVTIHTSTPVTDLRALHDDQGFDAVFMACGTGRDRAMGVPGEDLAGVTTSLVFLGASNRGAGEDLTGKRVVVVGGGNVAIDSARVALRLGAAGVTVQYRRSREEMPAFDWEVEAAEAEGIEFQYLRAPIGFHGAGGTLAEVESIGMRLGEPDESGRRRPEPIPGSERRDGVDLVITAIGLVPAPGPWSDLLGEGHIDTDPATLQTSLPWLFAGGDLRTGPTSITRCSGEGRRAAHAIHGRLSGLDLPSPLDDRLPPIETGVVLARQQRYERRPAFRAGERLPEERARDFDEIELALTEEEARLAAGRCLDCGVCSECHQCIAACPADAIDFWARDREETVTAGSVVVSTGFKLFEPLHHPGYGYGVEPNVISAMHMDRLLSPTRPYNAVLRPSDGKVPDNIAFVLCAGSRDCSVGNELCSRVCCMYTVKQAQLLMGAVPLADVTIYYIDIRAFGKGFEEFFQQSEAMGVQFVEGKVARVTGAGDGNLAVHYEDIASGAAATAEHDLVVLSVGLLPNPDALRLFSNGDLSEDGHGYVREIDEDHTPAMTSIDGVFAAGASAAVMDIPDTILHAGAAAALAGSYIERVKP